MFEHSMVSMDEELLGATETGNAVKGREISAHDTEMDNLFGALICPSVGSSSSF